MDRIKRIKEIVLFIALGFLIFTYVFQSNGVFAEIKLDSILLNSIVNIRYVSIVVLILGIFFDFIYDRDIIQIIVFCGILFLYITTWM